MPIMFTLILKLKLSGEEDAEKEMREIMIGSNSFLSAKKAIWTRLNSRNFTWCMSLASALTVHHEARFTRKLSSRLCSFHPD